MYVWAYKFTFENSTIKWKTFPGTKVGVRNFQEEKYRGEATVALSLFEVCLDTAFDSTEKVTDAFQ